MMWLDAVSIYLSRQTDRQTDRQRLRETMTETEKKIERQREINRKIKPNKDQEENEIGPNRRLMSILVFIKINIPNLKSQKMLIYKIIIRI